MKRRWWLPSSLIVLACGPCCAFVAGKRLVTKERVGVFDQGARESELATTRRVGGGRREGSAARAVSSCSFFERPPSQIAGGRRGREAAWFMFTRRLAPRSRETAERRLGHARGVLLVRDEARLPRPPGLAVARSSSSRAVPARRRAPAGELRVQVRDRPAVADEQDRAAARAARARARARARPPCARSAPPPTRTRPIGTRSRPRARARRVRGVDRDLRAGDAASSSERRARARGQARPAAEWQRDAGARASACSAAGARRASPRGPPHVESAPGVAHERYQSSHIVSARFASTATPRTAPPAAAASTRCRDGAQQRARDDARDRRDVQAGAPGAHARAERGGLRVPRDRQRAIPRPPVVARRALRRLPVATRRRPDVVFALAVPRDEDGGLRRPAREVAPEARQGCHLSRAIQQHQHHHRRHSRVTRGRGSCLQKWCSAWQKSCGSCRAGRFTSPRARCAARLPCVARSSSGTTSSAAINNKWRRRGRQRDRRRRAVRPGRLGDRRGLRRGRRAARGPTAHDDRGATNPRAAVAAPRSVRAVTENGPRARARARR